MQSRTPGYANWIGSLCSRRWARRNLIHTIAVRLLATLAVASTSLAVVHGQQPNTSTPAAANTVKHVLGLEKIKANAMGDLTVEGGKLQFKTSKAKVEVSMASVQDVHTEQDFKETIGGTAGTLARMAVPYGGGRVLSLFRDKVDVLTVEYLDASGGLHGAIFTLPYGQAQQLKRQMVAQGAHASIPPKDPAKAEEKKQ